MKVSFDFDGVLGDNKAIQKLAKALVAGGNDVWVLTSRRPDAHINWQVDKIIQEVGIPKEKVIYTPYKDKYVHVQEQGFELHFDDDFMEIDFINERCASDGILPGIFVGYRMPRPDDVG